MFSGRAFPVQQTIAYLLPGVGVWEMVINSTGATFLFAFASWHLLEQRAMAVKDKRIFSSEFFCRKQVASNA